MHFGGERVLVTGGAAGIGAATARLLAQLGAEVVVVDRHPADAVCADISRRGGTCSSQLLDVSNPADVDRCLRAAGPMDAVAIAAGATTNVDWSAPQWGRSFDEIIGINLRGAMECARVSFEMMAKRRQGRIVLIGSLAGRSGGLTATPQYVAAKGGLHAFTRWLAKRGGPLGIRANAVAPASIRTAMMEHQTVDVGAIPLGRMGDPEEVAWPIAFLCARASSYVTGVVLDVNGGVYMG